MAIYYVDTVEGSDANTGLSWAQAWKTCYPLKALYGDQGVVSGIEIRIAKTVPVETNRSISFYSFSHTPMLYTLGVARPFAGYRKTVIPDFAGSQATVASYGGTLISPFFSDSEAVSPAFRPAGTFKFRLDAPAGADGLAARWTLASGDFSAFQCFELMASVRHTNSDDPCPAEAWLQFSTDSAGTNIIWSRKLDVGTSKYESRMCLVGNNDLPTSAAYAFLRVKNPTTVTIHVDCTSIHAVLPVDHPNYYGLREIYVPNDKWGSTLCPSSTSGSYTMFVGIDGRPVDDYRVANSLPGRTWSVHRWQAYPYAPEALLPVCRMAGTLTNPIKIYGGWNKATGLVDGISAIDAANIRWFSSVRKVTIDVRNIAVACRRTGASASAGTPGIMEYTGYGADKLLTNSRAENVYLPAGGLGAVTEQVGYYYSDMRRDSLLNVPDWGITSGNNAVAVNCNTAIDLPFGGGVEYTTLKDCAWGMANVYSALKTTRVRRCRLWEVRPILYGVGSGVPTAANPVTYDDCDIASLIVTNTFGNDYACAPLAKMENCRLWGAHTGPVGRAFPSKNITYTPLPGVTGSICTFGADIDGLAVPNPDAIYFTEDSMFARSGYFGDPVTVTLRNATIQMTFSGVVPASASTDYRGHEVTLENVTLHKTSATSGAPFKSSRLSANGLTLVGAWPALQEGIVKVTDISNLVITDANTKLVNNFKFAAPAISWGRVCASYRNVVHPLGLAGFLGTPATSVGIYSGAAGWFHTLSGEMWASALMTVRKDTARSHSGLTSWKITPLQPIGAISAGSFMVGVMPVTAGVPITFSAVFWRDTVDIRGGIFIRPGVTREWTTQETVNAPSLHDVVAMQSPTLAVGQWETLTVTYTPYRDGLVEVHAGVRGFTGSNVWLDTLKVS